MRRLRREFQKWPCSYRRWWRWGGATAGCPWSFSRSNQPASHQLYHLRRRSSCQVRGTELTNLYKNDHPRMAPSYVRWIKIVVMSLMRDGWAGGSPRSTGVHNRVPKVWQCLAEPPLNTRIRIFILSLFSLLVWKSITGTTTSCTWLNILKSRLE